MPAPSDLVHQTTTSTGTGNLTLVAVNGKRSFVTAFGTGGTDTFDYFISSQSAAEWERGTGHETGGALVRDTVIASSNANALVNFAAGTKDVTNDIPAGQQIRGPGSSTDNAITRWDSTGGNLVQNSVNGPFGQDNGHFTIGNASEVAVDGANSVLQLIDGTGIWTQINLVYGNNGNAPSVTFAKTRNASPSGNTIVADDDVCGLFFAYGNDGAAYQQLAGFQFEVDGTPAAGDMPGRMAFYTTPAGSASAVLRAAIYNTGHFSIGEPDVTATADRRLHVTHETAATNAVTYVQRLTSVSTGTPAAGIGVGIEFEVETAAGNNEVGAAIEAEATDVTGASEDFELNFRTMQAGTLNTALTVSRTGFTAFLNDDSLLFNTAENASTGSSAQMMHIVRAGTDAEIYLIANHAGGQTRLQASDGYMVISTETAEPLLFYTTNTARGLIAAGGNWAIGAHSTPDRLLHVEEETAATNTVTYVERLTSTSSGTPANNIGVGIEFEVETAAANNEIGATLDVVAVDTTSTSEDFDIVFKTMAAGAAAAERFRIKSTNTLVSPSGQVAHFWVYWTGASTTILASHNVTSIDNDATGDAGINLTVAFSSANYSAFVTTNETGTDGWDADSIQSCGINVHTAGVVDVLCGTMMDGGTAVGQTTNPDQWQACGFGVSA